MENLIMRYGEIRIKQSKDKNGYIIYNQEINDGAIAPEHFEDSVINLTKRFYQQNKFFNLTTENIKESDKTYIRVATFEME